ncbi:hypothetical protein D3C85_1469050 [compost metagenome]
MQIVGTEPVIVKGDFFQASYFIALPLLDGFNKVSGFQQALMGAGVEPGETTPE